MSGRRGITIHLILAVLIICIILGTAWVLNQAKRTIAPPYLLKLNADYHLESAFILAAAKFPASPSISVPDKDNPLNLSKKEVSPGIKLTLLTNRTATDSLRFESWIEGPGFIRKLVADAFRVPEPRGSWEIEYLDSDSTKR